jgi:hypothetical protein
VKLFAWIIVVMTILLTPGCRAFRQHQNRIIRQQFLRQLHCAHDHKRDFCYLFRDGGGMTLVDCKRVNYCEGW